MSEPLQRLTSAALGLRGLGVLLILSVLVCISCQGQKADSGGLVAGRSVHKSAGVRTSGRLNDGVVPKVGGGWNTNRAVIFSSTKAFVDYDLGSVQAIEAISIMADNNDIYDVLGSKDGKKYQILWAAPRVREPGMRWRQKKDLGKEARFIRLSPALGDASLSVAELNIFSKSPEQLPPRLITKKAVDVSLQFRSALLVGGTLLVLASALMIQGGSLWMNLLLLFMALAGVGHASWAFLQAFPIEKLEVSLVRGVVSAVTAFIVMRQAFAPKRFKALKCFQVSVLALLALLSVGAFYNMGKAQFRDHKNKEPSVVHNYDMRVYFPVAKYFKELKYDGLYLGSIATYAEEHGGLSSPRIQRTELRDLRDHRMRKLSELEPEARAIRARFSDERWKEFKSDMRYFWETMGSHGYLGSMADHGGNATPVWLSVAYLMYGNAQASNEVLLWGAVLDPLLLLIFGIVVFRSFGARTAFVSLVLFGANDFYMFGSNWAGATLRNDWMVYLGFGVCALKTARYRTAGAFLALSALIRAFPAIALLSLVVPVLYEIGLHLQEHGKLPSWSKIWDEQRWFFQTALGATVCVVVSVVASSMIMGWDSWPLWVKKISSFTASPHVNHISLLTVIAGSEGRQAVVLNQRSLVFGLSVALYCVLAIWVALKSAPYRVALLGIMMMPVVMYPANYYMHFIFLLPLLVDYETAMKKRWDREAAGKTWIILLGICAAQYFTVREDDLAIHFYNASVILMSGLLAILVVLLPRDAEGRIEFSVMPAFKKTS